jgi:hypothetical protein
MAEEAREQEHIQECHEEAVPAEQRVAQVYGEFRFPRLEVQKLAVYAGFKDPYIGAVAACVCGPDQVEWSKLIQEMKEPPAVNVGGEVARRWQVGRALWHFKEREGLSLPELARRMGHGHHDAVWRAMLLYRAWPEGRLPEGTVHQLANRAAELLKARSDGDEGRQAGQNGACQPGKAAEGPLFHRLKIRIPAEIEAAARKTPDPYLAAVLAVVRGYDADRVVHEFTGLEPAPVPEGPAWFRNCWQAGRAFFEACPRGISYRRIAMQLGLSERYMRELVDYYRAFPDGRPDVSGSSYAIRERVRAILSGRNRRAAAPAGAAVEAGRAVVRRLEAMDDALNDLEALSRRVGRPLVAGEIESVATKHRVSPLGLMARWGNHIHASGAVTSRDLVADLQAQKDAWQEEKAALKKEVRGLKERLTSLEEGLKSVRGFLNAIVAAAQQQGEDRRASA